MHLEGRLEVDGIVGGGRHGKEASFLDKTIRGDVLAHVDGSESYWSSRAVSHLLDKMNTLVCELRDLKTSESPAIEKLPVLPELKCVK